MRAIDPKYSIDIRDGEPVIVKGSTGEPIPADEPLILFRARDRHAVAMLRHYFMLCQADHCTDFHLNSTRARILAFELFRRDHPDRMKQPGITKGL